ncbi:complex I subunit 5 family protein [Pleomorphochaeta sp. DL1XJH-081]|uniref:complex I subunit 5 family protein n=1 Tax=Pleomorphochaeta sp. DL1XJH-081 TaxID=3409690 RepID=UPI003BB762F8
MELNNLVFTTIMFPLLGAAISLCAKIVGKERVLVKLLEYGGAFVGLVLPWIALVRLFPLVLQGEAITGIVGSWYPGVGISYRFDGLAWLIHVLGFTIAIAAYIYALGGGPRGPAFTGVFLIQTAALAATIMTTDLFNLFVCLEVLGITSYVLIPTSKKGGASLAAFSYLMVSATAMVFFLLGTYGLYRITGTLSYEGITKSLETIGAQDRLVVLMALAVLVSAIAIRVAIMPLYGWLPDAHALAPHAVSAVLSGVLIKTPLFALSRVLLLFQAGVEVGQLMSIAGAFTALVAVLIALSQSDAKRLLAYHSISQIGYIVAAWGMAIHLGTDSVLGLSLMTGAYLHALYHALFKGLLFLSVGTTIDATGQRNVYELRGANTILRNRGEKIPITCITFLIGAMSISAIPPLNGFVSKTAITYAMKGSWLYPFITAASVGTVASFIKLSRIYWPMRKTCSLQIPTSQEGTETFLGFVPRSISQLLLAGLCIAGGMWTPTIFSLIGRMLSQGSALIIDVPPLYTVDNLLKILLTMVGGLLLYLALQNKLVAKVLKAIKDRPRSFHGLFVSFSVGTAALALWLIR